MSDFIPNNEHFTKRARNIRNELLNKTDKYILSDYPITPEQQMIIKTFARRRRLGWFESGLPWGVEPHDIPIGEQWGG